MRKNRKEYFLAKYLINNKDKLERYLGIRINELYLTENKESERVRIEGVGETGEKIFIKLQLGEGNYSDFIIEVQDIIVCSELENETKVVCIVINLAEEIIEELMQDVIFFSEKQIELVFLAVNRDAMKIFEEMMEDGEDKKGEEKLKLLERIFLEKRGIRVYNKKF